MIIVDTSQVILSNLMMQIGNHTNAKLEENMVRHMILNSLRSYNMKFKNEYGKMVLCCDGPNCWRYKHFPYYKRSRKKNRENSELDWKTIFEFINNIIQEIKEFLPYKVLKCEGAEADDIIATLVKQNKGNDILILSADKDFIQLHTNKVKQYDPVRKRWISNKDPKTYLHEHILKGDSTDGIPNVLSSDDTFVIGKRQRPMTRKRLDYYLSLDASSIENEIGKNYERNKRLIDLNYIPDNIIEKIDDEQNNNQTNDRSKMMSYFIDKKLKNLTENISEF
jgi:hypothetical protein